MVKKEDKKGKKKKGQKQQQAFEGIDEVKDQLEIFRDDLEKTSKEDRK